jgi:hypothetical protein
MWFRHAARGEIVGIPRYSYAMYLLAILREHIIFVLENPLYRLTLHMEIIIWGPAIFNVMVRMVA